jgi:hypothetical protein
MPSRKRGSDVALMLQLLNEAYEKKTWHGPNLKQSIRGVSAREAAWRPGSGRHNIWEFTLHAAYWKYAVRRRLLRLPPGSFSLKGHNFFPLPEPHTEAEWRRDCQLLEDEHRKLVATVANARVAKIVKKQVRMIFGVAYHDVYHAGQIRLLRRLQEKR